MLTCEDAIGFLLCSALGGSLVASYAYNTPYPFLAYIIVLGLCVWQWPRIKRFSDKMWREK